MSVCIILHEAGQPNKTVSLSRVPSLHEYIEMVGGGEFRVTNVKHLEGVHIGVVAVVNVMRQKGQEEPCQKP